VGGVGNIQLIAFHFSVVKRHKSVKENFFAVKHFECNEEFVHKTAVLVVGFITVEGFSVPF
jgi:hypothetical protein